jgi:hypothetical protein
MYHRVVMSVFHSAASNCSVERLAVGAKALIVLIFVPVRTSYCCFFEDYNEELTRSYQVQRLTPIHIEQL